MLGVEDAELPPVSIDRPVREQQPATFTVPDHLLDLMGEKLAGFGSVAEVARALEELPSDLDRMFNKMRKWGVDHSEPNACSFPGFLATSEDAMRGRGRCIPFAIGRRPRAMSGVIACRRSHG